LPVTERTAMVAPDVAHNATTEVRGSGPRKPAVAADARTGVTFVRADARGDRLEARSAILDVFRHWLSLPRLGWSALTAAWLAIIGLNLATHSEAGSKPSAAARLETRELIQGLKEYRAQLAQLMHETSPDPDKEPAANPGKTPGPRGDAERIWRDARL
ncbi:MAG TPA: hypothetical protein DCY13_09055, partial [Verrucomicrobiales bacterium]|nr:hypothetical protein [Verrucomicrobiales bacterium]